MAKKKAHFRDKRLKIYHGLIQDKAEEVGAMAWGVYTFIAMHANWETGVSYPSQKRLMKYADIKDRRTFIKVIDKLRDADLLTYEIRKSRDQAGKEYGRQRYYYKLIWPPNKKYIKPGKGNINADETSDP